MHRVITNEEYLMCGSKMYVVYQTQPEFCVKLPSAEHNDILLVLSSYEEQIQQATCKLSIAANINVSTVIRWRERSEGK